MVILAANLLVVPPCCEVNKRSILVKHFMYLQYLYRHCKLSTVTMHICTSKQLCIKFKTTHHFSESQYTLNQ